MHYCLRLKLGLHTYPCTTALQLAMAANEAGDRGKELGEETLDGGTLAWEQLQGIRGREGLVEEARNTSINTSPQIQREPHKNASFSTSHRGR